MVNPRQKGRDAEKKIVSILSIYTGKTFSLVPGSGSGKIKGDVTCENLKYCIEVKAYADSHINDKILTAKSNNIIIWWNKLKIQSKQMKQKPILVVKYNRSKWFVCIEQKPRSANYMYISSLNIYIMQLNEWLELEKPKLT